jgi:hypothetical protein
VRGQVAFPGLPRGNDENNTTGCGDARTVSLAIDAVLRHLILRGWHLFLLQAFVHDCWSY